MNARDHCEQLREIIAQLESEVRLILSSAGENAGMYDSAALALRNLEDSRAWLGIAITSRVATPAKGQNAAIAPNPQPITMHPHHDEQMIMDETQPEESQEPKESPEPQESLSAAPLPSPHQVDQEADINNKPNA